jgi:large conductance mechanosensitive channel
MEMEFIMSIVKEFMDFLYEYKIIGLAVAFIMGVAATSLVQSFVNNIIMPIVTVFLPAGSWQTATVQIGPFVFAWGPFLAALINFIVIAIVVFIIAKMVLKEEKVEKK